MKRVYVQTFVSITLLSCLVKEYKGCMHNLLYLMMSIFGCY